MADAHEIILEIDASRVELREGEPYLHLTRSDFDQVPRETLRHWYERADEANEVPFTVKLTGDIAGRLPHGKDLRMVMPKDADEIARAVRRSGIDLIAGDHIVQFRGTKERPDWSAVEQPRWTMEQVAEHSPALAMAMGMPEPEWMATAPRVSGVRISTPRDNRRGHEIQPTLSDALMFEKRAFADAAPRKLTDAIRQAHRTSRAFVFDRAASYRLGEICAYMPDLIADNQEFAKAPYPRTFVEFNVDALLQAMEDAGLSTRRDTMIAKDEKVGFLYTDRGIYTASCGDLADRPGAGAMWSPIIYRWHHPMTEDQEARACHEFGCSRIVIDQFLWGSGFDILDPSRRRSLRAQHGIDWMIPPSRERGFLQRLLAGGGSGDLKVALCAILLLIRPSMTKVVETREPGRKFVMGRPTTFIAHSVVTIRLTADQVVRKVRKACKEEAGRARSRWHEVRGHYIHNHAAKISGCAHDWQQLDDNHWECRRGCKGKRAWRTYPEGRGDASVGVVTKHYAVKR